jgi:hypothetical protein
MIIKGKSRGNGAQLGRYLATRAANENIRVFDIRGTVAQDVPGAVLEMDALGAGARTEKPLYHAHINTPANERLTDEQIAYAVEKLEEKLGLAGQPHVVMVHVKKGRQHIHVVTSRIDLERNAAISDSNNYAKHEAVARELEREFGLQRVQGVHAERDGIPRPKRTPSQAEMQQADRTKLTPRDVTEQITGIWRGTDTGQAFADGLWRAGYVLARGDRRDFVVIDPRGGTHSLARRIEGARVKDVRERLADLDPRDFPSVIEAKAIQRDRQERATDIGVGVSPETIIGRSKATGYEPANLRSDKTHEKPDAGARGVEGIAKAAGSVLDGIADLFENGMTGARPQTDQRAPAAENTAPEPEIDPSVADVEQKKKHQQDWLRQFGREFESEHEAEFERERRKSR